MCLSAAGKRNSRNLTEFYRISRNACENRQIVPFLLISVTRLLCDPAQKADFRAIFLHKTAFLCKILSVSFTFWSGLTRNFGAGTRNSEPRNSFFGARNFFFGARTKKSRYRNVFAAAPGAFFFPVGTFSRTRFPCHFVGGIPRRAFPPVGLLRRKCLVFRQKDRLGGDSVTF